MNDVVDDEFLFHHMKTAENNILQTIPPENKLHHHFSKRFLRKMKRLLKYERQSVPLRRFIKYSKRTAAIIFICFSITLASVMSVEAYRIRLFTFITTVWEELTSVIIHSEENTASDKLIPNEPTIIPNGFYEEQRFSDDFENTVIYINSSGNEIYYSQKLLSQSEEIFDTQNATVNELLIEEQYIIIIKKNDTVILYWTDEFYIYIINGIANENELIYMAESVISK